MAKQKKKQQQKQKRRDKRKWFVTYYLASGNGWPVIRRFRTERQARAYYKKLWYRREPPFSQSIAKEK